MGAGASMLGIQRQLLPIALVLLAIGSGASAVRAEPQRGGSSAQATASATTQAGLARHLRLIGAVFYGAWWCPHCNHQKDLFGSAAMELLPYVECDKDDAGRKRCQEAQVRAYPTWDLKGERRMGVLSLEELALWSGYSNR
ncbi:MAG: hypothetical protein RLZZ631_672 [Cyanobacteriota bacterium]